MLSLSRSGELCIPPRGAGPPWVLSAPPAPVKGGSAHPSCASDCETDASDASCGSYGFYRKVERDVFHFAVSLENHL